MADDNERGSSIVFCGYSTTEHHPSQPLSFDHNLSRQLDQAICEADACHDACLQTWALTRTLAGEAVHLADLRDYWLTEIVRLEAGIPTEVKL